MHNSDARYIAIMLLQSMRHMVNIYANYLNQPNRFRDGTLSGVCLSLAHDAG